MYYTDTPFYLELCKIPRNTHLGVAKLVIIAEWSYFRVVIIEEFLYL